MKHIKLFENFDEIGDRLYDNIQNIMVDLIDAGFLF